MADYNDLKFNLVYEQMEAYRKYCEKHALIIGTSLEQIEETYRKNYRMLTKEPLKHFMRRFLALYGFLLGFTLLIVAVFALPFTFYVYLAMFALMLISASIVLVITSMAYSSSNN